MIFSTVLTLTVGAIGYETYKNYQYERWKSYYAAEGNWYGKLTVPSSNKKLMWEYRPNSRYTDHKGRTIATNRYGFRGKDKDLSTKQPSTKRIAFLGDSATLGLFAREEDTFVRKFEYYANQRERKFSVEALNCAVDGYHALQLLELLKVKVLQLSPDMVVYVMHLNDFDFEFSSSQKTLYFQKPDSFLLNDIRNTIWPIFYGFHKYSFQRNKDRVFLAVKEMSNLLQKSDIAFVVVVLPVFPMKQENFSNYRHWKLHEAIRQFLLKERMKSMDLAFVFKDEKQPPKVFAHDIWHLNRTGHDYVARNMVPFLLEE